MSGESKFLIAIGIISIVAVIGGALLLGRDKNGNPQTSKTDLFANIAHTKGNQNSPIKIIEFADFQCPACQVAQPIIDKIVEENSNSVYFGFRHYPLPNHANAKIAAKAVESAAKQGKFWQMYDKLYENQKEWSELKNPQDLFSQYAKELNLNVDQFESNLKNNYPNIESDVTLGNQNGVESTPTFFINGTKYSGVIQYEQFKSIINSLKPASESATF